MSFKINMPKCAAYEYDDGLYELILSEKYHPKDTTKYGFVKEEKLSDNKIINFYENDKREIIFPSGNKKEIFSDLSVPLCRCARRYQNRLIWSPPKQISRHSNNDRRKFPCHCAGRYQNCSIWLPPKQISAT